MQLSAKNVASNKIVWSAVVFFWGIGHDAANAQELTRLHETVVSSVGFSRSQTFNASAQNGDMSLTARADGLLQNSLYVDRNLQQTRRPSSISAKIGGGFLGLVIGGVVGAMYGSFSEAYITGPLSEDGWETIGSAIMGGLVGIPIGWSFVSRLESPQREYFGAGFLGGLVGSIPGTFFAATLYREPPELRIATGVGFVALGAVIGRGIQAGKMRKNPEQIPPEIPRQPDNFWGASIGAFAGFLVATPLALHFSGRRAPSLAFIGLPVAGAVTGALISRGLRASRSERSDEQNVLGNLPVDVTVGPGPDGGFNLGAKVKF